MNEFDLNNYEKSVEQAEDENEIPLWVLRGSDATLHLYKAILDETRLIEERIKRKENLSIKERRIINRKLADTAKVDPSIINVRRQPDIVKFIESENERLGNIWARKHRNKNTSGKNMTRKIAVLTKLNEELQQEKAALQSRLRRLEIQTVI